MSEAPPGTAENPRWRISRRETHGIVATFLLWGGGGVEGGGGRVEREFFIDNLLVRIHLIIKMMSVDRPCAMGF